MRGGVVLAFVVAAVAAGDAAGEPFIGGPHPTTVVHSYRATGGGELAGLVRSWEAPELFAQREEGLPPDIVERGTARFHAGSLGEPGLIVRRAFPARPDRGSFADPWYVDYLLAQARGGKRVLNEEAVAGESAWRTSFAFRTGPQDECYFSPSRITIWLSRETLLPLRERGRSRSESWTFHWTYSDVNADLRDAEFARPDVGERPDWRDEGFRRTSPAAAAAHLSYRPRLPASLPLGFVLSVSGWAPRSPRTGAYERNPAYRDVFAAIYRRGFERIDVTQRLAGRAGWRVDPFRHECATQYRERATVGGAPGRYGIGPDVAPHVYWRRGRVLYTVSGPFPKRDLLAIASSLAPVP